MRRLIEPSHLDLRCLQKPIIIACGSERVKQDLFHLTERRDSGSVSITHVPFISKVHGIPNTG